MGSPSPLSARRCPRIKICGLRDPAQAAAVAQLGVDAIGVIGVPGSPRFVPPSGRAAIFAAVEAAAPGCAGVLVVADPSDAQLQELQPQRGHRILQLHGQETPERCSALGQLLGCGIWKALRIRSRADLEQAEAYRNHVDALLLDAFVADQLGGTGHRIPLEWLVGWRSPLPWWLAGGLNPERVGGVLEQVAPTGVDVSSGVEHGPADKDLTKVAALVAAVRTALESPS